METKLLVLSAEDAVRIGRDVLFRLDRKPVFVIEISLDSALQSQLDPTAFPTDFGIPTVALEERELALVNRHARFKTLALLPIPT